jgi:hypothetical protein
MKRQATEWIIHSFKENEKKFKGNLPKRLYNSPKEQTANINDQKNEN